MCDSRADWAIVQDYILIRNRLADVGLQISISSYGFLVESAQDSIGYFDNVKELESLFVGIQAAKNGLVPYKGKTPIDGP